MLIWCSWMFCCCIWCFSPLGERGGLQVAQSPCEHPYLLPDFCKGCSTVLLRILELSYLFVNAFKL